MGHSLRADLSDLPRKSVARATLRGETPRKAFAPSRIGAVIERAIALSGMTKQQAAGEMGYADPSALSRWIAGTDDVQFERLWSVPSLRAGSAICGLSSSTVYRLIASGKFPKQVVIDGTMARWSYRGIQSWLRELKAQQEQGA